MATPRWGSAPRRPSTAIWRWVSSGSWTRDVTRHYVRSLPEDLAQDAPQLLRVLDAVDGGDLEPPLVGVRPSDEVAGERAGLGRLLGEDLAGEERGPAVLHGGVELEAIGVEAGARGEEEVVHGIPRHHVPGPLRLVTEAEA